MPVVYDCETFPNCFTLSAMGADDDTRAVFEISPRRDDREAMFNWLSFLRTNRIEMIGFNNIGFDYPIIHAMMNNPGGATADFAYRKCIKIISGQNENRFGTIIWPRDRYIPQIDLFKIHHFDNKARSTGLKALEFSMRSDSVEDLPFPVGTMLDGDQIDTLIHYNMHDVEETKKFYHKSREMIEFRRYLSDKYDRDFMNHNDTKIGKDYFIMRLGDDVCYHPGSRTPRQTLRPVINLADVIFSYVHFNHPEFNRILTWFRQQEITETKGVFKDVSCTVAGFTFDFGTGGIHGSLTNTIVTEDDYHAIIDADVTSMYPSLAIVNGQYPKHLGERFCEIYADVKAQRVGFAKGTPENAMLKLALNGVYGDSNNKYSPFYDPQYTMAITVNGQLSLCMLAERLLMVPGIMLLQINTDGLTCKIPKWAVDDYWTICKAWEIETKLDLEYAHYSKMCIADVNSYIAVTDKGKVKRKGRYEYVRAWHQDASALVIAKAAESALVHGVDVAQFVTEHTDPFDFMLRAKAPGAAYLTLNTYEGGSLEQRWINSVTGETRCGIPETKNDATYLANVDKYDRSNWSRINNVATENKTAKTVRYYIAIQGEDLVKVSPPVEGCVAGHYKRANGASKAAYDAWDNTVWNAELHTRNQSRHETRRTSIEAGWNVALCNNASSFNWANLNREYYIEAAKKLVNNLTKLV